MTSNFELKNNLDDCLKVLVSAAKWRTENGISYSKFWDPELLTPEQYFEEFEKDSAYVLYEDKEPIATVTITRPPAPKFPTWDKTIDKKYNQHDCFYLDWIGVSGQKIGCGYLDILLCEVESFAKKFGVRHFRIDVDASNKKLLEVYKARGFVEVTRKDVGHRISVFMQRDLEVG